MMTMMTVVVIVVMMVKVMMMIGGFESTPVPKIICGCCEEGG